MKLNRRDFLKAFGLGAAGAFLSKGAVEDAPVPAPEPVNSLGDYLDELEEKIEPYHEPIEYDPVGHPWDTDHIYGNCRYTTMQASQDNFQISLAINPSDELYGDLQVQSFDKSWRTAQVGDHYTIEIGLQGYETIIERCLLESKTVQQFDDTVAYYELCFRLESMPYTTSIEKRGITAHVV